jgi:hypothetical protein
MRMVPVKHASVGLVLNIRLARAPSLVCESPNVIKNNK